MMDVSKPLYDEEFFSIALMMLDRELAIETDVFPDAVDISMLDEGILCSFGNDDGRSSPPSTMEGGTNNKRVVSLKSRRYRNRKREELEHLRSTVKTLEVRLAALKSLPTRATEPTDPSRRIWEALALVESEQRREAELINQELREVVELHYQLAQKLQEVLDKVCAQCGMGAPLQPKTASPTYRVFDS